VNTAMFDWINLRRAVGCRVTTRCTNRVTIHSLHWQYRTVCNWQITRHKNTAMLSESITESITAQPSGTFASQLASTPSLIAITHEMTKSNLLSSCCRSTDMNCRDSVVHQQLHDSFNSHIHTPVTIACTSFNGTTSEQLVET